MKSSPGRVDVVIPGRSQTVGGDHQCSLYAGTCGYSYTEWTDSGFYPATTKSSGMLSLYGHFFSVVELNYTWYQMARADGVSRMVNRAPGHLLFAAKLTRTMTHERDANWREQLALYLRGIAPLKSRLAAILVQFPPYFYRTVANRNYLAALLDGLHEFPVAVEFRHVSWAVDSVFVELERRRVSLVVVDEPELPGLFPALDVVTNPALFYVRFHGRNREGWHSDNMQKKFNYDYSEKELHHWADTYLWSMAARAERGMLLFNNHVQAQAPRNAQKLVKILASKKIQNERKIGYSL